MRTQEYALWENMREIEKGAGIYFCSDWDKYRADQESLAAANPEYKALRDERSAIIDKKWKKKRARQKHARELWASLLSVLSEPSLTDAHKAALRVACEILWQCKPATIERAEKTIRQEEKKAANAL